MRTSLRPPNAGSASVSPTRAQEPGTRRRIVVAEARVPFALDGAELHAQALVAELRMRGHDAETVALPFRAQKSELLDQACAWRMLNLSSSNARPIDVVIATRFPTWFVRHPRKVAWVIHQHRAAYDLFGTEFSDFTGSDDDGHLRQQIIDLDSRMLGECERIVTNAQNTADRLKRFNRIAARPLYHPPPIAEHLREGMYGDYVLVVARFEPLKRVELAIRAMAHVPAPVRLIVVGEGSQRAALEREAAQSGAGDRIEFAGAVWGDTVATLYADALAVVYVPFDEDYGYVTLEAFLASKPVITATDSGGPLEFVVDGTNGLVSDPDARAIAGAINRLAADRPLAERLGRAGRAVAQTIGWDGVIEQLVG
jgi:glycosyltransferase involved in cell wall biosynthesis